MQKYEKDFLSKYEYFNKTEAEIGTDYLTGVLDRRCISAFINYQIANKHPFGIAICDFDNFKLVNDRYGHYNGDIALIKVAEVLKETTDEFGNGVVGRFGGDEFLLYFDDVKDYEDIWTRIKKINDVVKMITFEGELSELYVTQTIGAARYPFDADDYEVLFKKADKALYRGKQKGRNCFIIYKDEMHRNIDTQNASSILSLRSLLGRCYNATNKPIPTEDKIQYIFKQLRNEFSIDHICINNNGKLEHETHCPQNTRKYEYLDSEELATLLENDFFYTNNYSTLKTVNKFLHQSFYDQEMYAVVLVRLVYNGEDFGIVRVEDSTHKRIWQEHELVAIQTLANIVAMIKYIEKHN